MNFTLKFDKPAVAKAVPSVKQPVVKLEFGKKSEEIRLKDIFVVDELPDEVIETINVYDLCKVPFFYAGSKEEMLSWLQPHSIDIAIFKLEDKTWKKELTELTKTLGFRSSIYILDNNKVHNSVVESWLMNKGYKVAREGKILDFDVVEYEKGYELSIIDCFNPAFSLDIFSVVFNSMIGFGDVVYCDVVELIDIFYHGVKNDKNIFMPIPFNQIEYACNYLETKVQSEVKVVDKTLQIQLF